MRVARPLLAFAIVASVVVAMPSPASAHNVGGREPTNARVRITAIVPPVSGIDVRIVDFGHRVELHNTSRSDAVVLGYAGEPYLRVGPDGVFENVRAPAVYQNRTSTFPADLPKPYDASAPPEWHKRGNGDAARWHDHRAHAMPGPFDSSRFTITLIVDGRSVAVRGDMAWIAPSPWWPWPLAALATAVVLIALARRAWRTTVAATLALCIVGEVTHVVGSWHDIASSNAARAGAQVIPLAALVVGLVALARTTRRPAAASAPWVLIAAVMLVVAGGFGDVATWYRSQLPWSFPDPMARALVALAFGGGSALAVAAVTKLSVGVDRARSAPATDPLPARPH